LHSPQEKEVTPDYGSIIIPRLSLVGKITDEFYMKLLLGEAYKAPTVFQLHDEWRGNAGLKPQKILTTEIESGYRLLDAINLRANIYYSILTDLITIAENPDTNLVPIGPNGEYATYYQNFGDNKIYGISLFADLIIIDDMHLSVNYSYTSQDGEEELTNIAPHKINLILNYRLLDHLNINLRANYLSKVKAPKTNLYFYPMDAEKVGYEYVTEDNPDGYLDEVFLLNLTLTGKDINLESFTIEPQLICRNLLNTQYYLIGRQSGDGTRPVDELQPTINNPAGFIPAYHPQAGMEIFFRMNVKF
jgi:outer membrane receptor for ferrienterochelin and colicins